MLDESRDPRPDQRPTRRAVRPIYLWTLAALVGVMVVGTSTLTWLCEQAGLVGWGGLAVFHRRAAIALVLGTLALAPVAVLRSRTLGREFSRSYGASAALAAATGLGFAVLQILSVLLRFSLHDRFMLGPQSGDWPAYLDIALPVAVECSVVAIVAAWLTLTLTGVGRRATGGFELLCLWLGLLWILTYVARRVLDIVPWLS